MFTNKLTKLTFSYKNKFPKFEQLNQCISPKHTYTRKMKLQFNPELKGVKQLNRDLFKMELKVPAMKIKKNDILRVRKLLKNFSFDSVVSPKRFTNLDPTDSLFDSHKYIFLDPDTFKWDTLEPKVKEELVQIFKTDQSKSDCGEGIYVEEKTLNLEYSDFKFEDVIKAIIPDDLLKENVNIKGYSVIGHIAHFNLKAKILEYKNLIGITYFKKSNLQMLIRLTIKHLNFDHKGEILLDKISNIKTVVNKLSSIDNTYRNFELEILAGENNTMVQCKENNCFFKFDFAKVYWNPRLSTEHERIVNMLSANDVVYDVFAGVGPFSIPAVTNKRCQAVLANDLNPNSYRFLLDNYKSNNKSKNKTKEQDLRKAFVRQHPPEAPILESLFTFSPSQNFQSFNLDGRQFIQEKLKYHFIGMLNYLLKYKPDNIDDMKWNVLMNLPAMSVEFLDAFKNLYDKEESAKIMAHFDADLLEKVHLSIYCYHFAITSENELEAIQKRIKNEIFKDPSLEVRSDHVRNVAPNKEMHVTMFKVSFKNMLTSESEEAELLKKREEQVQNTENGLKTKLGPEGADAAPAKVARLAYENSGFY